MPRCAMRFSPNMMAASAPATICATLDRKSTRLNSSHLGISYAVFCLKKKKHVDAERLSGLQPQGRDDLVYTTDEQVVRPSRTDEGRENRECHLPGGAHAIARERGVIA